MDKTKKRRDFAKEAYEFYKKHRGPSPLTIAEAESWDQDIQNAKAIREYKEQEAREKKRLELEELKKRAAEEKAKQDEQNAAEQKNKSSKTTTDSGVAVNIPRLQISSYVPDTNFLPSAEPTPEPNTTKKSRKVVEKPKHEADKYYPTNLFDTSVPTVGFDTATGKPSWGTMTMNEQMSLKEAVENTPLMLRTKEDQDYYDQLKRSYVDSISPWTNKQQEQDLGYRIGPWSSEGRKNNLIDNNIGLWGRNKNETEISSFAGDILKNRELRGYVEQLAEYQKVLADLTDARKQLSDIQKNGLQNGEAGKALQQYINAASRQIPELKRNADVAVTYLDQAIANKTPDRDIPIYTKIANFAIGQYGRTPVEYSNGQYNPTIQNLIDTLSKQATDRNVDQTAVNNTILQLKNQLDGAINRFDEEDEVSREGMRQNMEELEKWNKAHPIDADFLAKAEKASQDLSFLDPDTYLYGLSGVLGSSAAFNGLQWANTVLSTAGGLATSTAVGAPVGVALTAVGSGLGMLSGARENASEVYENVQQSFGENLRKSGRMDEFVKQASDQLGRDVTFEEAVQELALGNVTPSVEINKILTNSTFGANNLFKHDMFAVTADNLFETVVNFVPYGRIASATILKPLIGAEWSANKIGKLRRLAKFKAAAKGFSETGYNIGASINPVVGAATATLAAATRPIRKPVADFVSRHASEALMKRFGTIAEWAEKAPKKLLNAKVVGRSAKDWLGRTLATSWSESIEEGKQYYNGKQFAAGNYAGESDSWWDVLLGDIEGGSKSALQFTGSFLGLGTDKEWITNMRGGFLAGGGHTAIVSGVGNARGAVAQIKANNVVVNNILATKLAERASISKGISYAGRSSFVDRQAMNKAFDDVKALQRQITQRGKELGDPSMEGIADELIEDQRTMYNRIFNLANSSDVQAAARKRGIEVGSNRYNTLVSLLDFANQEGLEALNNLDTKQKDIAAGISEHLWGKSIENLTDQELSDVIERSGIRPRYNLAQFGPNESGQGIRQGRMDALQNISNFVDYVAHLDALMSYRDQLVLKDHKTAADKRKLRSINKQIEDLRNSVKTKETVVGEDGKEKTVLKDNDLSRISTAQELQSWVYDTELHEVVRDQYRDVANFVIDLDNARALRYNLVGRDVEGNQRINNEQERELLDNIGEQARNQYEATAALTDNKDVKISEESVSHGELDEKAAKKANKVIDDYLKAVKDDEQFEQEIHDDMNRAIEELYGQEEDATVDESEVNPQPEANVVENEPAETVQSPSETVSTEQPTINPEAPQNAPEQPEISFEQAEEEHEKSTIDNLYHYVDAFPLKQYSEDESAKLSQKAKDMLNDSVNNLNKWIEYWSSLAEAQDGMLTKQQREMMNLQYQAIVNGANIANTYADLELFTPKEDEPSHTQPELITNEDVINADLSEAQKYVNNLRAAVESGLQSLQELIQTYTDAQSLNLTDEGVAEIMQAVSNLDAIFNSEEIAEGLIDIDPTYYLWYYGADNDGARQKALDLINGRPEELPEPVLPTPPTPPAPPSGPIAQFDTTPIDDPDNWSLMTKTRWNRPGVGGGIQESVATDDSKIKLTDVIGDNNFLDDAQFELVFQGNNQPFVVIRYKGHTFTPVFIQTAQNQNRQKGYSFWNAIKRTLPLAGPNQMVVPVKVSRTTGKEKRTNDDGSLAAPRSLFDVGLIRDDNMYELELSVNQDVFGITEEVDISGTPTMRVYTPSAENKGHMPLYEYSNSNHGDRPSAGVPIMMIDRHYNELGSRKARVPVNMMFTKLSDGDAELIADILKGKHCENRNAHGAQILAEEYVQLDERGNLVHYGITNGQVLNLLMKYGYRYPEDRRHVHLEYNNDDNRKVSIVGFIDGQSKFDPNKPDEIPSKEYNLFDENELQMFLQDVAGVINRNFDQIAASSRVGEQFAAADSKNPFRLLNQARQSSPTLQDILKTKGKIQFGNSSIEFDEKDFVEAGNPKSQGVSGMVWYARHGFLQTRFNGFENTLLVFDEDAGVKVVDRTADAKTTVVEQNEKLAEEAVESPVVAPKETAAAAVEEEPTPSRRQKKDRINIVDDDELLKVEESLPSDKERINLEEAKQNILRILGENGMTIQTEHENTTLEEMLTMFGNGPVALGFAKEAMIGLSKYARRGTEYHEAFHIVVELLLSDKKRDAVYKAYAKTKHIKLYNNDGSINVEAQKQVTEGLADEFMLYMMDRPTIKLTWNIKSLWNSIKNWTTFYRNIGSLQLIKLYTQTRHGKFRNLKPTKESSERFKRLLDQYKSEYLPFSLNGKPMQHIASVRQYKNLCKTMVYILFQSQPNIDRAGRNMQDFKMDDPNVIREYKIFKKYAAKEPALNELLDNWDVVREDIRSRVAHIANPYVGPNDDIENVEDMQGDAESVANAGIGDHIRDSQEFSQFSRAGEKVKFFFSIIPNVKYGYDKHGNRVQTMVNNAEGLPEFVKPETMYNTVLNQVYNCRSLEELISRLETLGQENAQFALIAKRINNIKAGADAGNVEDATLLTQMMVNLHASKGNYVICKASKQQGGFNLIIQSTDTDYEARNYRREWSQLFAGGASKYIGQNENGEYVMKGSFKPSVFNTVSKFLNDFADAVSPLQKPLSVAVIGEDGKLTSRNIDVTKPEDLALAKAKFVSCMNALGIQTSTDVLNYMLSTKYGSTDHQALNKLFSETQKKGSNGKLYNVSIRTFAQFINGFNNGGKLNVTKTDNGFIINGVNIQSVFSGRGCGFVGMLAEWSYNYKKAQDQLSILANKQNRQYLISENNYLTDTLDDMNASVDGNTSKIDDLKSFVYNWDDSGNASIIVKNYSAAEPKKLTFVTNSGFKTDSKGDIGEDYAEISPAQDEVSKIQMLLQGKIILPTLSDKKTWGYIDGLTLPGLNMEMPLSGQFLNQVTINPNGSYTFSQNQEVLDQLRQYAILEHKAVLQTLKDVKGYTDENGVYHKPLTNAEKIKNYHTAKVKVTINGEERSYNIIQGARYSSMYCMFDSKGRKIHFNRVCDENGNFISEEKNIEKAAEYFFGYPSENEGMYMIRNNDGQLVEMNADQLAQFQRQIIARSLQNQLRKQLQKAEKLGLIERTANKDSVPYIYSFKNKLLDLDTVNKIKNALPKEMSAQERESLAIAIMMNDVSCKSIMSLQETERIFSGHPAFYKWVYNSKGYLSDRSTDQHKRFGGLVSTGQNNAFVFKDLPTTYTAAEINDLEIASPHVDYIEKNMYEGELRSTYLRKLLQDAHITMNDGSSEQAKELANKADSSPIETIEEALQGVVLDTVKKRAEAKTKAFKNGINVADGATYITDDMCENLLKQVGAYGEDIQRAFKVLRGEEVDGRVYTTADVREMLTAYNLIYTTVIGTQKYTAYGFRKQNGVLVPYYNKTALFPLFKQLASGNTAKLYAKMKKDGVDMVMFNSAVKVGSQGSQDINFETLESEDFKFNTYTQEYKYLRKQFNTDPKEKEMMAMGTQMTKIIMSAMLAGRDYIITNPDGSKRTVNVKDLRDEIMDSINNLAQKGYDGLRERLFDGDRLNIREFSKFLVEELSSRGASQDLLRAVSVVDENTSDIDPARRQRIKETGRPELRVPLVALSSMNWIQSVINSKVNKSIIDINTPGAAFIQRSVFGMEGTTKSDILRQDEVSPDIYEGRELQFRNENGSMDCVLSIDFFANIIPENLSFEEARQWLIDNKVISGRLKDGTWSDADASIIGYRIPTQAQSSIHALRCVDVLPVVRDTVILPKEFTKITGSDFDIDKLFLSTLHYNKKDVRDSSGNLLSRTISKEFKEDSEQYYANRLILDYISLLKDSRSMDDTTTRSMQVGDASIDNDTKLLTDIVEDLEGSLEEDLDPYDTYSLWRNTSIRDQFITGKFGIGPFALNNNNHILTMLYGVRFANNPGSILGITGHESLHDAEDMYGESIMSWLSGLINAHVDVAKDPYISKLNVNKYTYNLVNLMIRTGFGKMTFYFMTQPIMKELAMRVNNAASAYGSDSTKSKFRRQKDAEDQFIIDYANAHLEEGAVKYENVDDVIEGFKKHLNKLGTSKTQLIKAIFDPKSDFLHEISKSKESLDSDKTFIVETSGGKVKLNMYEAQMLVYAAKLDFDPYSDGISQLVKYCKIDTKKQGKNISEQRDFKRGYRRLFVNNKSKLHRLFDDESLQALRHQSYIKTKTELALNMFSDILSDQLLDATRAFNGQVEDVIRELPVEDDEVSQQLAKKVSDAILVGVRSDYFNTYADRNNINIKGLVSGNNTIYDRLNKLKVAIQTDDKYAELRNPDGSIDNYLLNILTSGYTHKQVVLKEQTPSVVEETYPDAKFVSSMTFMSDDSVDADEVSEAWEELLEDSRFPELQQLAKDLIVYSFITTGGNGGSNNIFKYIPISWLVNPDGNGYQASYAHFMEQKLENYRNMTGSGFNVDDVILNNWTDEQFIPTITTQDVDTFYSGQPGYTVVNGRQVNPNTDIPIIIRTKTKNPSRFVKIRRQYDPESQRSVAIYKRVKVSGDGSVYVLVDPKGQNFGGKNKIFEYGRSDASVREVAVQLKLNPSLVAAAQTAGADMSSIESVLNSLIRFVDSKEDKRGAIDVLKNFGVKDLLSEVIQENVDFGEEEEDVDDILPPMRGINDADEEYVPFEEVSSEESTQDHGSAEQKINRLFDEIANDGSNSEQQEQTPSEDFKLSEEEQKEAEEYKKACEGGKV